jgi:hypothetical protein
MSKKGKCRACGCTDDDCSGCVERTGKPCRWVTEGHDLCSACVGSPEFQEVFVARAMAQGKRAVVLETDLSACLTLIPLLQLALRHPGNRGRSHLLGLTTARRLIDLVAGEDDVLRVGLEAGFDPRHDVPRKDGGA